MKNTERNHPSGLPDLPPGWLWASPQDLCAGEAYSLGIGPFGSNLKVSDYRDSGVPLIFVRNIRSQKFDEDSKRFVSIEKADELRPHWAFPGDLLITKMGEPPGDVCLYPTGSPPAVITADCIKFRLSPTLEVPRYFVYALRAKEVRAQVIGLTSGVAQQKISLEKFKNILIPVAPLSEQARIVAEIEKQLTDLEAGVAALKRVQANLKRYRASVLKAACEGRLVPSEAELARSEGRDYEPADKLLEHILKERRAKWEADQLAKMRAAGKVLGDNKWTAKYEEPVAVSDAELAPLPDGWAWARAEQLCGFITKGTTPAADKLKSSGAVPYVKVYNLTFDGSLNFALNPTFIDKNVHEGELARSRVFPGDVLMNIVGPPLGKVSIIPDTYPEWNINQAIAIFRSMPSLNRAYLSYCLQTEVIQRWAVRKAKATVGQFNLTLEICRDLPLPLPPAAEQARIVSEVERHLSIVDECEQNLEHQFVRADRLRQSILKRAFEGKLVPQDPSDEPASVLLDRIRQERASSTGKPTPGQMSLELEKPRKPRAPRRRSAS